MGNPTTENKNSGKTEAEELNSRTASNCYLNYLDYKCLDFLAEEICKTLEGENNLSKVEKAYWLRRLENYNDMSQMSLKMVKDEVEFYQREQAINALVPFAGNAHLN